MSIYIYNSLTRKKEEFIPISPPKVNIYTCGVTVYDESHIGHARSLYIFDVIRRYLKHKGYEVKFVRNITDIDDKIINRAKELKIDWKDLVKKYIGKYYEDLEVLGIEKGDFEPRATGNIADMIKHIEALIAKGYAYLTDSGVYFSVRRFSGYGKLSGQGIDQMLSGVRIEADEKKQDPLDFAVWKRSKEAEPCWDSPWGKGRPGWHIECSVMSMKYLKTQTLDIHAGGRDLIFPHHENEIAQAESLSDKPFAKYWIHHGLLTINAEKMAKSAGNFISIKDALNSYPAEVLKTFYLQAHYSSSMDFSWAKMEEAKSAYERLKILLNKLDRKLGKEEPDKISGNFSNIDKFKSDFEKAMDDDFNMPLALAALFEIANTCNKLIDNYKIEYLSELQYARTVLLEFCVIFGLSLRDVTEEKMETWVKEAIEERVKLKEEKKYAEADEIRKSLEEKGIILEDTKEGTVWRKKI